MLELMYSAERIILVADLKKDSRMAVLSVTRQEVMVALSSLWDMKMFRKMFDSQYIWPLFKKLVHTL